MQQKRKPSPCRRSAEERETHGQMETAWQCQVIMDQHNLMELHVNGAQQLELPDHNACNVLCLMGVQVHSMLTCSPQIQG
jgi:hypothetical protein